VIAERVGIVVIGRNEGELLPRCLRSVQASGAPVVYVDSGSVDGSCRTASDLGAATVDLDPARGFTAARARNAGFERLLSLQPRIKYVQFVDGDCELDPEWLGAAVSTLDGDSDVALVCGRVREAMPEASIYNRLCDIEWDTPAGVDVPSGGIAMVRAESFAAAGGFRADLVAGEEPELCVRLRQRGLHTLKLPTEMARHDAALLRFSQWWRRCVRAGHAYAQGAELHRGTPERYWMREASSILFWGVANPILALAVASRSGGLTLLLLVGYPALAARIWFRHRTRLGDARAFLFASFCTLAKFPQACGVARFAVRRIAARPAAWAHRKPRTRPVRAGRQS
jgi:GT2 family glycosyltransferase